MFSFSFFFFSSTSLGSGLGFGKRIILTELWALLVYLVMGV